MSSSELNRALWDERAPVHAASDDYGVARFASDPAHLSDTVRFDLPRLGDIRGLRGVHLQCHIGTDTVSLARLGAHMSGLDFSPASIEQARGLSEGAGAEVSWHVSDVHDAVEVLGAGAFDLVYTGIGALCWLPSAARWAQVVAELLTPGGRLFLREASPVLWAVDESRDDDLLVLEYPYRETPQPMEFVEDGTYVSTQHVFPARRSHTWNHGMGEIVTAVLDAGLVLTRLEEHDSVPWEAIRGRMEQVAQGEWRLRDRPERLPHTYTLQAVKRG